MISYGVINCNYKSYYKGNFGGKLISISDYKMYWLSLEKGGILQDSASSDRICHVEFGVDV